MMSRANKTIRSNRLPTVLCIAFVLAGAGLFIHGLLEFGRARRSPAWPTVKGTVVWSVHSGGGLNLMYRYEVDGQTFEGYNVGFGEREIVFCGHYWRRLQHEYPKGKLVDVFYDPAAPELSVLEPGIRPGTYTEPILGVTFAMMAIGFWFLFHRMARPAVPPFIFRRNE